MSDASGSAVRFGAVGTGLPTTAGQTITNLPGFATSTGSPYGFFSADLDPDTPGLDTLYVAGDSIGLTKYSLVGGSWTANGTVGTGADPYRGLTGVLPPPPFLRSSGSVGPPPPPFFFFFCRRLLSLFCFCGVWCC